MCIYTKLNIDSYKTLVLLQLPHSLESLSTDVFKCFIQRVSKVSHELCAMSSLTYVYSLFCLGIIVWGAIIATYPSHHSSPGTSLWKMLLYVLERTVVNMHDGSKTHNVMNRVTYLNYIHVSWLLIHTSISSKNSISKVKDLTQLYILGLVYDITLLFLWSLSYNIICSLV